ncbi:centrosome and spindle pole associated protein 1 [Neoarius graeffei]|uniref:centrosome and spindle pole associated protein 1 n=1 Tax=Neoarius graeffei TaxID=443677 RepID=UPI00298D4147|nr:centrosome and spindle pole associated protein 1 [Neoarius graeffei]XP_060755843.1 centrosome and spindle pole associated protein 1 [Neoarius graeffei]
MTTLWKKNENSKTVTEAGYMPYMEMKSSFGQNAEETEPSGKTTSQHLNTTTKQNKDEGYGLSLQLGEEYEKKKQKLKEELRLDYRRYVLEKQNVNASEPFSQHQTLSLPTRARRSSKLQDERVKEYSPLLQGDEEMQKMRKTSNTPQPQVRGKDFLISTTSNHPSFPPKPRGRKSPERVQYSKRDDQTRRGLKDTAKRWHRRSRRERYSSEEELNSDEEEQEELELLQKRRPRYRTKPTVAGRRRRKHQHRADRFTQERREVEVPTVNEEENRRTPPAPIKANSQAPTQTRAANERNMAAFATGLMIGVAEGEEAVQRRKERYRQELLEQIAEQRRNKKKEKELELRVAATGATDPEKEPNRIKQFGGVCKEHEGRRQDVSNKPGMGLDTLGADVDKRTQEMEREPPEKPRLAFQSPMLEYSAALGHLGNTTSGGVAATSENFHKDLSGTVGEMVAPSLRVARVPPPPAPTLSKVYNTPYDEAYYYYGARNPLDLNLAYYGPPAMQPSPNLPARALASVLQPPAGVFVQPVSQHGISPSGIGAYPSVRHQHPKDYAPSYKDALKQQIEERQERRRQEREEKERYEAKLEAEMEAYEPWGRGGAGAPLKDNQGNLSDLKRVHRTNEEADVNPESGNRRAKASVDRTAATSRAADQGYSPHRASDNKVSSFSRPSPHARGNVFSELPTPQQLREQERYKECLKQQIEEKRRMEAERKERLRLEEEKEEKRLAEERAHMQRQFKEEQEKERRKEMERKARNQEMIWEAEERRKKAEKKEEDKKASEALKQKHEQERRARLEQDFRSHSPPIPTVQKRLGHQIPPRPPSVDSQRSATVFSVQSVSTPQSPPVPARRNQIRTAEEQQDVIRELSVMRRHLKSEQKRLEGQLLQSDREDTQTPLKNRALPRLNAFDMARLRMQVPVGRPPSNTRPLNKQIVQDFNQLKYRDSESREQVRQAYPGPPTDEASLEIQQQALLREQQRRLDNMQRARAVDCFDLSSPMKPAPRRKDSCVEEAESASIDANGCSFPISPHPDRISARERRRRARRADFSNATETFSGERISYSLGSADSLQLDQVQKLNQRRMRMLDDMSEKDRRSGDISVDEEDDFWQQSPPSAHRVSTTTVATEAWLRPGTTETLKKLMAGRRPSSRNLPRDERDAQSTYQG